MAGEMPERIWASGDRAHGGDWWASDGGDKTEMEYIRADLCAPPSPREPLVEALREAEKEFRALYRAYVSLLGLGRTRIIDLGGACDPVDVMEAGDPALARARAAIAAIGESAP